MTGPDAGKSDSGLRGKQAPHDKVSSSEVAYPYVASWGLAALLLFHILLMDGNLQVTQDLVNIVEP